MDSHVVFAILCFVVSTTAEQSFVHRQTLLGKIKGVRLPVPGSDTKYVDQYRKIPFASPPINKLRFQKPKPYGKWQDELDGTQFGPSCSQTSTEYFTDVPNKDKSEDCLHLNIYVPSETTSGAKLPVMVFVHGGAFYFGQGMFHNASNLASTGNVIVVTINYRLGIFGFLTLDDPIALGNYGIWDQILALRWIKENIESYGGDPDSVTIFGESAGGMSVSLLSIIPSNKGLFHRVIAQSGTSNNPYLTAQRSLAITRFVGVTLGCKMILEGDKQGFMKCMREKSSDELLNAADFNKLPKGELHFLMGYAPVVDGELFPDQPSKLLTDSYPEHLEFFQSLDHMIGITSGEGSLFLGMFDDPHYETLYKLKVREGIPKYISCDVIAKSLVNDYFLKDEEIQSRICEKYSDDSSLLSQSIKAVDMYSDFFFNTPSVALADIHSNNNGLSNTFFYILSRPSPVKLGPVTPDWYSKSRHSDDIQFLFGMQSFLRLGADLDDADFQLSQNMMKYWSNFASNGNVNNPLEKDSLPLWPLYNNINKLYVDLDSSIQIKQHPAEEAVTFWLNTIPGYLKSKNHSHDPEEL